MKVLVADPIAKDGVDILQAQATVDVKTGLRPEELLAIIGDYEALVVRSETKVTAKAIEAGSKLLVIGRAGVGVDNIDVEAATKRGIVVVNAPTGNTISAAEHTVALLLAAARNIPQAYASLKAGQWKRSEFLGVEVRNKTLGLIGLGKVGSEVARRAQGLEMKIIAHDPFVSAELAQNVGTELVSLEELFRRSDFISVHTPLTASTRDMIGAKELAQCKPTARIINCARGGVINEDALFEAVESGKLAGAAVDVFSQEPATDNKLTKSNKIITTPHLGASTTEAQVTVAVDVAEQVLTVLKGRTAKYAVNAPLILPETLSVIAPYMDVGLYIGRLVSQLSEGQPATLDLKYEGEIAGYDSIPLKASVIRGLYETISEARVNLVNADLIARNHGLKVSESKRGECENYASLITAKVTTSSGETTVAGTVLRGETHIVMIDGYWLDVVPTGGYAIICDHRDRPGLIGTVGTILGNADINISTMRVGRLKPRGKALMLLGLDEPISEKEYKLLMAIPDVYSIKQVKL